ncbi:MAG: hypothetical protein KY464_00685 [Gemmatimonadetes bacterium]|nr:hypothetical protein [Gemmatimonadota bacterium]
MRLTLHITIGILLLAVSPARAQTLRVEGDVGHPAAVLLRDVLARGSYLIIHRDTVLPADTRIRGDLVVIGADVRLEGRVDGSVVVLPGADFFVRPGATIAGTTTNVGGGVFISSKATATERLELPSEVASRAEYQSNSYVVYLTPPPRPPLFETGGVMGVGFPTYDRVNGVTLRATGSARLYADTAAPKLTATALYHQARNRFGAELSLLLRIGPRHHLVIEAADHSATNDGWIRPDLSNSLAAAFLRSDLRNYYGERMIAVELAREAPTGQRTGRGFVVPRVRLETSRAESLRSRDPWTLFGDEEWRENPPIDAGRIVAGTLGAEAGWRGATSTFAGDAAIEWAPPALGDFDYSLFMLDGRWNMIALWGHTIGVRGHFLHPLGSSAPAQRWSIVGGSGTLPTLATGERRGDHLVFVESSYGVPLTRIVLPFVGSPVLVARHAVGSAWISGAPTPDLEQNLGLGLAFPFIRADLYLNPADRDRLVPSLTFSLPF